MPSWGSVPPVSSSIGLGVPGCSFFLTTKGNPDETPHKRSRIDSKEKPGVPRPAESRFASHSTTHWNEGLGSLSQAQDVTTGFAFQQITHKKFMAAADPH